MEEKKKIENNIVYDAYYLISLFNDEKIPVTQLQVQKLMYFFEAYYMVKHKEIDKLYDCNFNAWAFGPVAIPLYSNLKIFGQLPIRLTDEQIDLGKKISGEKKNILKEIYETFKDTSAMRLVELTHMEDSPWYEVWHRNGDKVAYGSASYIDKLKTREWFEGKFVKINND